MRKLIKSFRYAFAGLRYSFKERNMKIHLSLTILIIILGLFLKINSYEWLALTLVIGMVLSLEIVNTAIEDVCDRLRDDLGLDYTSTKNARDVAAASVLIGALTAVIVGLIIFLPKLVLLIQ